MEFEPLAGDSLGIRSFAMNVTHDDWAFLIDPGIGLGGTPDGLPPHPVEYQALQSAASRIDAAAETADSVVITHYHHDHFVPLERNYLGLWSSPKRSRRVLADKHIFAKDPTRNINQNQADRARELRRVFTGVAAGLTWADGREREVGPMTLRFSPPVPHGRAGSNLGWVIMVAIDGPDRTVVYTSDVQGPIETHTTEWILAQHPDVVIVDGPSLSSSRPADRAAARDNLRRLAEAADLVVDHHLYRVRDPTALLRTVEEAATAAGHTVDSVATYRGESRFEYETVRKQLHRRHPVEPSFYPRVARGEFADEPIRWQDWAS